MPWSRSSQVWPFRDLKAAFFPGLVVPWSISSATAIFSAIASGMIALTGIVFSLAFVMIQFSSIAYSPRLALWIARDPFLKHALGVFTATFLYALVALSWVGRNGSLTVPLFSSWIVIVLLMASVAMFVGLTQRLQLLQMNSILRFTGDQRTRSDKDDVSARRTRFLCVLRRRISRNALDTDSASSRSTVCDSSY